MSESKFKNLQKEVCDPELEPQPLKKFCAPCVPNESYIEPDWEFVEIAEPYLNEKQCEYQITVTVNKFGDSFSAKQFRELRGGQENFRSRESLLRSFIHPALVLILEEYGKLVADQIICATFPSIDGEPTEIIAELDSFEGAFVKLLEQEVDRTRVRCDDFGTFAFEEINPSEPFDFQRTIIQMGSNDQIQNPFALELYTRVNDFYIDPIEDILKVHIAIPAFILDQVPELPSKEELEEEAITTREEVVLKVDKLFGQMKRLEVSLQAFGKYQSYFYQTQNGFLKFKESNKDFYATRMSSKIGQFYSSLKQLAKKNKVNIRSNIPSVTMLNADNVRIEFKKGPNGNPYVIKAIYAWKEGCEEKKLRKGIKKFKQTYNKKPTVMNYVAKLNDIDMTLQARETTPWLDFLVKYTYPLIIVDYGTLNMQSVGDTLGKCVEENVREFGGELKDYILSEALSFMDSLSFQYSSAASCEELYATENQPEVKEFEKDFGLGEGLDARKRIKSPKKLDTTDTAAVNEQVEALKDSVRILNDQLDQIAKERRKIKKQIDDIDAELKEQNTKWSRKQTLKVKKTSIETENYFLLEKKSAIEIDKTKISSEIASLTSGGKYGKSTSSARKAARKAAAKKARRNAKNHPYTKKAAKIAMDEIKKSDTLLASLIDWEKYEKDGKLSRKKFERNEDESFLKDVLSRLSICSANTLTVNAVRCLFSGVTKERAFDKMFRSAMKAMDLDVFGFFIGGLPPDAQTELRQKFEKEFGNIPLPWEENYDPGAGKDNQYKNYLSANINKDSKRKERKAARDSLKEIREQYESEYKQIIDDFEKSTASPSTQALKDISESIRDRRLKDIEPLKMKVEEAQAKVDELQKITGESSFDRQSFKNLSNEDKNKLIEEQKKDQGTFGTALGNIQQEVVDAYIEYIFDVMNIEQIGQAMSQVPGGTLVFNTLDQIFKCSSQGLFNPPLSSFLSSFSLDVCGPTRHVGIAVPTKMKEIEMPSFSKAFFIQKLKNAFITKMETVITKVITMLLLKLFETIDNALCKSLNAIGQAAIGTLTGGPGAGLDEAFADAFCPDADEDELNNVKKNAFGNALGKGAAPDSAYDCLFKAINGTMSKREIIDLLTNTPSNMDDATANKFALLVNSRCPELSDLLGDSEDVKDAFGSMGRYIPPELKDYLRNQTNDDLDAPIYDAICLTQDELDLWNAKRRQLYEDNGLDAETAEELINKANERALDNLGSLADILQKGPQGLLEEALDAVLKQADPACANDPAAIIMEDETFAQDKKDLMNDYFKRIENKFLQDLIGEKGSLLGNILIDTQGNHLQQHDRRVKLGDRTILYANYVDTEQQWEERNEGFKKLFMEKKKMNGMLPDTVGLQMLNQLKEMEFKYKTSKDEPQLKMKFETTIDQLIFDDDYKTVLNYKLNHNKKSTQRAFIRESVQGKFGTPDVEVVLSAKRNQIFDDESISAANYNSYPNEVKLFIDLLQKASKSPSPPTTSKAMSLFDNLNNKVLSTIRDAIVETPNGTTPVGFNYGYEDEQAVGFEDLLYVNPEADPNDNSTWDYTFDEEDAVLGKSATENPRVHFLDPAVHGGRYKFPKIYVEPATYNGWLGAIRAFIPQVQTCEDKDNGFLNMTEIAKRAKQVETNLPIDARLNEPLECRLEVPYDRQIMPANHGLIEGVVISTIRSYATEFMVRSFPVFGSIQFNENNYDSLISQALADHMHAEMSDAGVFSNISRLAYYLLFLEQSVQVVQRQIIDGLMQETEEIREASRVINKAQNDYEKLKFFDFISGFPLPGDISTQINKGLKILAFGNKWNEKSEEISEGVRGLSGYNINLARKVAVIHDTQNAAEVFLSALIAKETSTLSKKLNLNLRPRPHIFDIKRYMLSTKGIVDKSDIKAGFASVEQEVIEGGNQPNYGTILDCAGSDLASPLGSISKTPEEIKKTGILYLEKYVRVINKDQTEQVMKISEFQRMISDRSEYDENLPLSEYFGDAEIIANKLIGSIGVKFGVRLMICLDKHIGLQPTIDKEIERIPSFVTSGEEKIGLHCFPIASYELDLMDDAIKDIDLEDPNLGEDIKCYVDQLTETDEYMLLFDTIIKARSFCSLFGIYSFQNFIQSIGQLEVDEDSRKFINRGWKKKIFDDTKRLLRKQFRSIYSSQDDADNNRSSSNRTSNIDFLKNLAPDLYLNVKGVGFLQRIRIVDANPFDENGKPCINEFQKLFED